MRRFQASAGSAGASWILGHLLGGLAVLQAQVAPDDSEYPTVSWEVVEAVTTLALHRETFAALGVEMTTVGTPVHGHVLDALSVVPRGAASFRALRGDGILSAIVGADGFHGFEGGPLRHTGGTRLRVAGRTLDLSQLELRWDRGASTFEIVDSRGVALLTTANPLRLFDAERQRLRYLNADVQVLPALAELLGDTRYAGMTIGVLDLEATLRGGRIPLPPLASAAEGTAPPPCFDWSGIVDVAIIAMADVSQAPGGVGVFGGRSVAVVVPSAQLENVGTANVPWYTKFTNLSGPTAAPFFDQHPYLVWQVLRVHGGLLEPLGRSDLKHAFATENAGCEPGACTDPHILGLGCADTYNAGSNTFIGGLGPRSEVNAFTGIWPHCGGIASHFDVNGDCQPDFFGSGETQFTHGAKVAETDLQVAGATYFMEAFYIVRDDVNIFNSMGYRRFLPSKPASNWVFPNDPGFPYTPGPAINAWVNPTTPGPGADNRVLDTGAGRVQLAVRVTDVVGSPGRFRYAYALQNHDYDRRVRRFHVPFDAAGGVDNVVFSDGDGVAANDWVATVDVTGVTWVAPPDAPATPPAALDYASLVALRFDSDQAPAPANVRLGTGEGCPAVLDIQSLAPPSTTGPLPAPGFYSLNPCRLLDTREGLSGPLATGGVRFLDVGGRCGVPSTARTVAVNVTAVSPTTGGAIELYDCVPSDAAGTVRFNVGGTRANNAIVGLNGNGEVQVRADLSAPGSTHVVIDVVGYFVPVP